VSCTTCRATFAALAGTKREEHALRLDQEEPRCRCQRISVSEHSPGPVHDTETLIRIVIVPYHINRKTGLLKASVLTHAGSIGMSVFREESASNDEIRAAAMTLVQNARKAKAPTAAGILGLLKINCGEIRTFCWERETDPCYCVYDTATKDAPAHADAFQRVANVSDQVRDARRNALFDRVKADLVTVDEFRGGLLKDLAPGSGA
jgi:hypothetical protein